jgi:thymidylate synthase ThyX
LTLRTAPSALLEFRELATELFEQCPEDYKPLLEDCVYKQPEGLKDGV